MLSKTGFRHVIAVVGVFVFPTLAEGATVNFGAEDDALRKWAAMVEFLDKPFALGDAAWAGEVTPARYDLDRPVEAGVLIRPDFTFEAHGQIEAASPLR